jgi:hypothetical protein
LLPQSRTAVIRCAAAAVSAALLDLERISGGLREQLHRGLPAFDRIDRSASQKKNRHLTVAHGTGSIEWRPSGGTAIPR